MRNSTLLRMLSFPFLALSLMGLTINPGLRSAGFEDLQSQALKDSQSAMVEVADGSLAYIQGHSRSLASASVKAPRQNCLRGVKQGLMSGGVFKRYPAWRLASQMVGILNNNKKTEKFLKNNFKFIQLPAVKDVGAAPSYSIIVYGGRGQGHIELKVPASHLLAKGYHFALMSVHGKEIRVPLTELNFVYISDYIDAYPRNHPNSRIANKSLDNERPVRAIFELRKT